MKPDNRIGTDVGIYLMHSCIISRLSPPPSLSLAKCSEFPVPRGNRTETKSPTAGCTEEDRERKRGHTIHSLTFHASIELTIYMITVLKLLHAHDTGLAEGGAGGGAGEGGAGGRAGCTQREGVYCTCMCVKGLERSQLSITEEMWQNINVYQDLHDTRKR